MLKILIYSFGVLMVAQLLGTAIGLQCYDCIGPKGQKHDCEVKPHSLNAQNCTAGFSCFVYITTMNGNQSTIYRSCSPSNQCEVIRANNTHLMGGNNTVDVCYSCNSNLCNSSESFVVNSKIPYFLLCFFVTTFLSIGCNKMLI